MDGKCANYKLSQQRGSPQVCVPIVCRQKWRAPRLVGIHGILSYIGGAFELEAVAIRVRY